MYMASVVGHLEVVKYLVESSADIDNAETGVAAVDIASHSGLLEVVKQRWISKPCSLRGPNVATCPDHPCHHGLPGAGVRDKISSGCATHAVSGANVHANWLDDPCPLRGRQCRPR